MIDNKVIISYNICPTKSYKYYAGEKGNISEYEKLLLLEKQEVRKNHLTKIKNELYDFQKLILKPKVNGFVKDITFGHAKYKAHVELIETSDSGELIPIIFSENDKLSKDKKLELQWIKFILDKNGFQVAKARMFSLRKSVSVTIKDNKSLLVPILQNVEDFVKNPPRTVLNRHCKLCEFEHVCRNKLEALDDLSLIG